MILLNNSDISTSERYIAAICAFVAGSVSLGCVHISNIYLFIVLLRHSQLFQGNVYMDSQFSFFLDVR